MLTFVVHTRDALRIHKYPSLGLMINHTTQKNYLRVLLQD